MSTSNGLDSVVVELDRKGGGRLTGTLGGGEGACHQTGPDGESITAYCVERQNYAFDAPLVSR